MSVEGNTNLDSSPVATSLENAGERDTIYEEIIEGYSAQSLDSSAPQSTDSSLEHENGDSSSSTNIEKYDSSAIATSQDNAEELDTIYEGIIEGSSARSLDSSVPQSTDSCLEHENGDSSTSTNLELSDDPLVSHVNVSDVLKPHKRTFSDVPTKFQLDTAITQNKLHKRTYSSEHVIDTAAPIESVKEAVSKFGGIVDWKAHKTQTEERRKIVESKLEKIQEEILKTKKGSEEANDANDKVLSELDNTKRTIEELKLIFERAQTEEQQAKQDSELAKLKVKEVQQGVADEASIAANAEFEVAQTRHAAAIEELKSVKDELEKLRGEYSSLIAEKDLAVKRAEEALSASMEVEKTVEALTLELNTVKGSLESAHAAHLEAEEQRLKAEIAKAQDFSDSEKELKKAEEELEKLNQENQSKQEIKSKLEDATTLLLHLKAELATYKEGKSNDEKSNDIENTTRELEEIRNKIEKAMTEVKYLKVAFTSLESELEQEKLAVSTIKKREGMASVTVASLETDLKTTEAELELILAEKEGKEDMEEVPNQLNQVTEEKEKCKSLVLSARVEMSKAKDEAEVVKASAFTIDRKLHAAQKEIEAARASERFAFAAAKALKQSELIGNNNGEGVTLSLEEYQALSKKACDAEAAANCKLAAVIALIEEAKKSEVRSLEILEQVNREKAEKKEEYTDAIAMAEKGTKGKLATEQELRKWRTERRTSDVGVLSTNTPRSRRSSIDEKEKRLERSSTAPVQGNIEEFMVKNGLETDSSSETEMLKKKRKKKSLFPRIVMFLARRKVQSKVP